MDALASCNCARMFTETQSSHHDSDPKPDCVNAANSPRIGCRRPIAEAASHDSHDQPSPQQRTRDWPSDRRCAMAGPHHQSK